MLYLRAKETPDILDGTAGLYNLDHAWDVEHERVRFQDHSKGSGTHRIVKDLDIVASMGLRNYLLEQRLGVHGSSPSRAGDVEGCEHLVTKSCLL